MKVRAFTLLEVICVMLITAALMCVCMPVFQAGLRSARTRSAIDRLRQLHIATTLYINEWGGGTGFGSAAAVGLPPGPYVYTTYMGFGKSFFVSPCGYKPEIEPNLGGISVTYTPYFEWTAAYFKRYRENSVIYYDLHCTDDPSSFYDRFAKKRGLAVLYGGKLVNRYAPGLPIDLYWFSEPPD